MKIEWLFANATAVGSPARAEHVILGLISVGCFLANLGCFAVGECDAGTPFLSPNRITSGNLMKTKWLVANVTAVGAPDRAERATLEVILAGCCFGQSRPNLWSGTHSVM